MSELDIESGLLQLSRRANFAAIGIYGYIAFWSVAAIGQILESNSFIDMTADQIDPLSTIFAFVYMGAFAIFIVSAVLVSMWIYRAHANLISSGVDLTATPGWAIGWFFVPILNLFRPFQSMRSLWFASQGHLWEEGDGTPALISWWWGLWLAGNTLSNIGNRVTDTSGPTPV